MTDNHLTIDSIQKWIWPHVDFGKKQVCAKFLGEPNHKHGETIEFESPLELLGNGVKYNGNLKNYKGVFRLIEKDLYRDDWMAEALPLAKEYWEKKRCEYPAEKNNE